MSERSMKAMAKSRAAKFGHFIVEFATPGIGHILKNAGCDFVLFDLEHSGFHFETVKSAIRYFEAGGVAPSAANICTCTAVLVTWSSPRSTWLTPIATSSITEGSM